MADLLGQHLYHVARSHLAAAVQATAFQCEVRSARADVDDAAAVTYVPAGVLQCEQRAFRVQGKKAVIVRLREVQAGLIDELDSGIGYSDVDGAEFLECPSKELLDVPHAGHVRADNEIPRSDPAEC